MLLVLLAWGIISLIFLSLGNTLISLWNTLLKKTDRFSIFDTFWIGLCFTGTLLLVISLLFPINIYILALFAGYAILYFVFNYRKVRVYTSTIKSYFKANTLWGNIAFLSVFLVVLSFSLEAPMLGDYGLYHQQTMMWTEQYSVVPGLGNIHGRLGFNSSFFLLTTLFSYHPDTYPLFYPLNSLCLLVLSLWLISRIKKDTSFVHILGILGIFCCILIFFKILIPSSATDFLPGFMVCYILLSCITSDKDIESRSLPLFIMSAFCITLKLSSFSILFVPIIIVILLFKSRDFKVIYFLVALGAVIFIPWCLRFVIQTGYLVYPFPSVDLFSFDWKIPINLVQEERDWVYSWSRIPKRPAAEVLALPFTEWFSIWMKGQEPKTLAIFLLAIISPLFLYFTSSFAERRRIYTILGIALCGIIYCLTTAPDLRFAFGFVFVAAFVPFWSYNRKHNMRINKYATKGILVLFYIFSTLCIWNGLKRAKYFHEGFVFSPVFYQTNYCNNGIDSDPTGIKELIINNITIYIPKSDQCFGQCLPCTPYPKEGLEMRGQTFQDGFRIR